MNLPKDELNVLTPSINVNDDLWSGPTILLPAYSNIMRSCPPTNSPLELLGWVTVKSVVVLMMTTIHG